VVTSTAGPNPAAGGVAALAAAAGRSFDIRAAAVAAAAAARRARAAEATAGDPPRHPWRKWEDGDAEPPADAVASVLGRLAVGGDAEAAAGGRRSSQTDRLAAVLPCSDGQSEAVATVSPVSARHPHSRRNIGAGPPIGASCPRGDAPLQATAEAP